MKKLAVIITALLVEYKAVKQYLTEVKEDSHEKGNIYDKGIFKYDDQRWEVGLVECGKGNQNAAVHTERAIEHFKPEVVLFVGVAGGIKDVQLGDIVASEKVYGYEFGKDKKSFHPRPELHRPSFRIGERAKHEVKSDDWIANISGVQPDPKPQAYFAPIAAGEKVVASTRSATYKFLKNQYGDALAVEMEGIGFLTAAYANQEVQSLLIRGISDLIDGKELSDKQKWQEKAANNASAFAFHILKKFVSAPGSKSHHFHIPHPRNPLFTGREEILGKLRKSLVEKKDSILTQAIRGLGGLGKTQTALEYAYRYKDSYDAVLWVKAGSNDSIVSSYIDIAAELGLSARDPKEQERVVSDVKNWLTANTGWLVIFDNVDDEKVLNKIRPDYIPSNAVGVTLVTTRLKATGTYVNATPLEKMTLDEGACFLLRRAKISDGDAIQFELAKEISRTLGGLPLALDQAGAFIEATQCGLKKYIDIYKIKSSGLHGTRIIHGAATEHEHPESVTTTFTLCFDKVLESSPVAGELIRFCAFLDPDGIPIEIFTGGASKLGEELSKAASDQYEFELMLSEASRYSLIEREGDTLEIHRLVQAVIKDGMSGNDQRQWAERAVNAVNKVFPYVELKNWPICKRLLSSGQACAGLIEWYNIETVEAALLLNHIGFYLNETGRYEQAEPMYKRSLEIREQVLGKDHFGTATGLNNLAGLYDAQGRYKEAEPMYQRSLEIREQVLGKDHPATAESLNNLAGLYREQGRYEEAEQMYKRSLGIREQVLGKDHPDTATSLNNLAGLYRAQGGRYEEAEQMYKRSLGIREQVLGKDHPDTATSLNNLAGLYYAQGMYEEAEPLMKRAIGIREKVLGASHPTVVTMRENYTAILQVITAIKSVGNNEAVQSKRKI
ncbi:tetratricopeptide repeat protein [Candidatus Magnetominusculus xianensis]|uniref:XRE family transcriptional regulator n=1 Tax=Candidatus Magnetominusculus xianensis TaxID=1748249 RepID=A0ABR5SC00_9BACT|nr:tetratricopeptide repeat protein [Candidatus Magnetominusculus xianensis]KWT75279.1 XRE family transcriptional regulator [Candidatus Magnetominusculus xianensis]MBF0405609.1 tetratricopeptide repeat protein [Nitrospirota bacterium]